MKEVDICYGEYASVWGLTDFYLESEKKLQELILSGEDFDTGWFGCKKEIRYARYVRNEDSFLVEVSCHMDDLFESEDLIYDALWWGCLVEEELPDEVIDSIRDWAIDVGMNDYCELSRELPRGASFAKIVAVTKELEDEAEKINKEAFDSLIHCVRAHYDEYKKN